MGKARPHIACILASGFSKRFGSDDKLLADFQGRPLIHSVITVLKQGGFDQIYAVVPQKGMALHKAVIQCGAGLILNDAPENGQSYSVKLAARRAIEKDAASLLIALGDMPFVSSAHISALQAKLETNSVVISSDGENQSPPALFHRKTYAALSELKGDIGAREIIKSLGDTGVVMASAIELLDINTSDKLKQCQA